MILQKLFALTCFLCKPSLTLDEVKCSRGDKNWYVTNKPKLKPVRNQSYLEILQAIVGMKY